jgi:hypothetical protein
MKYFKSVILTLLFISSTSAWSAENSDELSFPQLKLVNQLLIKVIRHEISPVTSQRPGTYFSADIAFVTANYSTGRSCPLPNEILDFIRIQRI